MSLPLYFDHNIDRAIALGLRRLDVLLARDDDADTLPDEEVFERATALGRVMVSNDWDYVVIARRWQRQGYPFAGLVHTEQEGISSGAMIDDLELVAAAMRPEEMANWIEFLPYPGT